MKRALSFWAFAFLIVSVLITGNSPLAWAQLAPLDFSTYDHVDPLRLVPEVPLKKALAYFETHRATFSNQRFVVVIDFTKPSSQKRFFLIDLKSGLVEAFLTAHGKGSDPQASGYAHIFSNIQDSKASSLGFYRTAEVYQGENGRSLRLDGLSLTNSQARARDLVVHGAAYVSETAMTAGRSWGCPALDPQVRDHVIDRVSQGALLLIWAGGTADTSGAISLTH